MNFIGACLTSTRLRIIILTTKTAISKTIKNQFLL